MIEIDGGSVAAVIDGVRLREVDEPTVGEIRRSSTACSCPQPGTGRARRVGPPAR